MYSPRRVGADNAPAAGAEQMRHQFARARGQIHLHGISFRTPLRPDTDHRHRRARSRGEVRLHRRRGVNRDDPVNRHMGEIRMLRAVANLADNQLVLGRFHQAVQLPRHVRVMAGNLVRNPQRNNPRAAAAQGAGMGIGPVAHGPGRAENFFPRSFRHLRIPRQRQRHQLTGNPQPAGNLFLRHHFISFTG
jgi:hypothetical protein